MDKFNNMANLLNYTLAKNRFVAEFFGEINVITGKKINNKLHTPLGDFDLNNIISRKLLLSCKK